jgi:transposase
MKSRLRQLRAEGPDSTDLVCKSSRRNWEVAGICALLVVLVFGVFGQTLGHGFVNYDDSGYVYQNPIVSRGLSIEGVEWAFTHLLGGNWHPLTTIFHMLDCQMYGLWAGGHHLTELAQAQASRFFDKLDETLEEMEFASKVHGVCAPLYSSGEKGRPPIDPVVYFKMLMVGFLENLPSERAIAARCGDSLMIRRFLGYELNEDTPHHSSFTVIRQRLSQEVYQSVFDIILEGLRRHGLLRGKNLGIDSSVMEANASLRALENRNTGEAYWEYVRRLAPRLEWTRRTPRRCGALTNKGPGAKRAIRSGSIP